MLARTSVRSLGTVALIALLAVVAGLWSQSTATNACTGTNCENVPSQATVGGQSGVPMTIECKWEMADASPLDAAMTYGQDDTPSVIADGPACDPGVTVVDTREHMIGLLPNAGDQPVQRQYEKWVAVHSANVGDIIDVYWKVWEPYVALPPNGPNCASPVTFGTAQYCFKYQHHATATQGPPTVSNPLGSGGTEFSYSTGTCAALEAMTAMFNAAVLTGEMTQAEVTSIIDQCYQSEKAIFRVQEQISKDQPWGEYRVEVTVVNSAGGIFQNVDFFDVLPFIYISKDFNLVDWQTIVNGGSTIVSGDTIMEPVGPAKADGTGVKPTIENTGNQNMYVSVHFNPLILQSDPTKSIVRFDSRFRADWKASSTIQVFDPQYASDWVCFDQHPVGSDGTGKLDLSVHPEAAQAGSYTGSVDILGWGGGCPP